MGKGKSGLSCCCPNCGIESNNVKEYKTRKLKKFSLGCIEIILFLIVVFRCMNKDCRRKTFTHIPPVAGTEEIDGKSPYTKSCKKFVANKMLTKQVSYNSFQAQIKEDFGSSVAVSTLYTWTQQTKVINVEPTIAAVEVLHTDEKHPSKKKRKCDKKFIIASAGRADKKAKSRALHANLAESNDKDALAEHYDQLIDKGLNAEKVELVVTDMLPAYTEVIKKKFPNALHQYCVFHFIQNINKIFKDSLKAHRHTTFEAGERKPAHKISFLLLKGQEKLTDEEQIVVSEFCQVHPNVLANYAFKEDIRFLYATAESPEEAYAYKDMIECWYKNSISKPMEKALNSLKDNFEQTIAYLRKGYLLDKTNNDAERMMRTIKRTQQTHYFLRKEENYIKKVRCVLGIQIPIAV